MMKNLIKKKKGEKSKITFIKKQIKIENSNWMELFQGPSGSGKTWAALSEAYQIDPTFDVSKQLVFDFRGLMQIINDPLFIKRIWKIIIFDEPQISISNRNWQNIKNKMMNYLATTFRHQHIILFFCCPYRDFLDSASMKMIHAITEMVSIDRKKKKTKTRPKLQQYNSQLKKTYEHSIFVMNNGKIQKLIYNYVPKPPQAMIDTYEQMKTEFTTKLNQEIESKLDELEGKEKKEEERQPSEFVGRPRLTQAQLQLLGFWKRGIFKYPIIAKELGVTPGAISQRCKQLRKKSYCEEEYSDIQGNVDIDSKNTSKGPNLTYKAPNQKKNKK